MLTQHGQEDTRPPRSSARATGCDTFHISESNPRACSQRSHVIVTSSYLRMSTHGNTVVADTHPHDSSPFSWENKHKEAIPL